MRRREFIALLGGAATWPTAAARAQQVEKVHRVGLIFATSPVSEMVGRDPIHPSARAFVHTLRDLGYVEARNLVLEHRSAEGKFERFADIIAELVRLKADVIVTSSNPAAQAAKTATTTVPIVMLSASPVEEGLIDSLARPGGNITGLTLDTSAEIFGKRLEILKEVHPTISRMAVLQSSTEARTGATQTIEALSRKLGLGFVLAEHRQTEYDDAFAFIERERADALLVPPSNSNFANRRLIVEFAARNRLPAMYGTREFIAAGGLISYGAETADLFRRLAGYVDRILKGTNPGNLPVEQPTKYQLIINLKTAKALGLAVPPSLLARADEVIE